MDDAPRTRHGGSPLPASPPPARRLADIGQPEWDRLARRRIFFGHQSVGRNLLDGLDAVLTAHPHIRLTVIESRDLTPTAPPAFRHALIGRNHHPLEKLDDFARIASAAAPGDEAIAMMKLCYVDVEPTTDAAALFAAYRERVAAVRASALALTLVHVTMPVTAIENWKGRLVTTLTGRPSQRARNVVRGRYNALLRAAYEGVEPVFDLAALESTHPDGRRSTFTAGGSAVEFLVPEYSDDGAHLDASASRRIAERLLVLLASLPAAPRDVAPRGPRA